jgi:GT2 family glycosyltransferase
MKISVIIVNYNVEHFLEQCLNSAFDALKNVEGEIWVVDNNSIDGSMKMVKQKFPEVLLIENKNNVGFSVANNQAIKKSNGEYVLLLNPDTVVEEDTFEKVVSFMDEHPDAGGLGVKMIDGKGNFLPESKRGLPTPSVAFYKIFGLSSILPKSKKFGKYHLGFLDKDETHEIEILSGAFMLMRKETLDKVGLLDENFFMYGEDIDLSWRIIKGGYKNYYYPGTRIIHYKGESTKKTSVNYVFVFYKAMVIFAKKHFSQKNAKTFSFLINLAIYFRAGIALFTRFIKKSTLPIFDFAALSSILFGISILYHEQTGIQWPEELLYFSLPIYSVVWCLSMLYSSGYDKPIRLFNYLKGATAGTVIILVAYALLPDQFRFSRLIILVGGILVALYYIISRAVLSKIIPSKIKLGFNDNKNFAIVGDQEEIERVENLLKQTSNSIKDVDYIIKDENALSKIEEVIHLSKECEIIFCAKNNTAQEIISAMHNLNAKNVDFKIAQPDTLYLIGSNSIETKGDLYTVNINSITNSNKRRNKRTFDFVLSLLILLLSPILIFLFKKKFAFIKNLLFVLIGKKSFVGYDNINHNELPKIKPGILHPSDKIKDEDPRLVSKINLIYARDYHIREDLSIILKSFKELDRQ